MLIIQVHINNTLRDDIIGSDILDGCHPECLPRVTLALGTHLVMTKQVMWCQQDAATLGDGKDYLIAILLETKTL